MIFSWLQNLFPQLRSTRRVTPRKRPKSASLVAERLECRTLLTPFYDVRIVASTGGGDFESFGDLVSINNQVDLSGGQAASVGTVAYVGFTDADNDGNMESGLWTVGTILDHNVNPDYSDTNGRDFGRAVAMNNNGVLVARDRYAGSPAQFFVRTWDSDTDNEHTNIASANSLNQPDYGDYSGLQTFTDINDEGDVVFVGQSLDGSYRTLVLQRADGSDPQPFFTLLSNETVPRPQLTADGRVLYRATDSFLVLLDPESGTTTNVAAGFTNIGYASGISDDGRLISFIGDKGDGLGVYLAYQVGDQAYQTVRIAGGGMDGWASFDPTDAVRVNNTLMTERGVTVAYEGIHSTLGAGIYTTRVGFIDSEGPVDWDPDYALPYVQGAVPVLRVGETIEGHTVKDIEFWNGLNDRNRGELAFWIDTNDGQRVVRAEPWQVVSLDFTPSQTTLPTVTNSNMALLRQFGINNSAGWDADFSAAMQAAGMTALVSTSAQDDIVNKVQSYFDATDARIHVIGKSGEADPVFVTYTPPIKVPLIPQSRGVFQTVLIGAEAVSPDERLVSLGYASPTFAGQGGIDFFNQITDDSAVIFADRIFKPGTIFTNPTTAPYSKQVQALSAIIAHEIGHNFGLFHLDSNLSSTLGEIMRAGTPADTDLTHSQAFEDRLSPRDRYVRGENLVTPGDENSVRRLRFAAGTLHDEPTEAPEDEAQVVDEESQRAFMAYLPSGQGPTVARMLLGTIRSDLSESLPEFEDLGEGTIAQLLAAARLETRSGARFILLGSTDGIRLDIVGIPHGSTFDLADLDPTFLGISANSELQLAFNTDGSSNDFQLFYIPESGSPVQMGTAQVQNVPELNLSINGAQISQDSVFGMGETTPGGGPLNRLITITNTGSGTLNLGAAAISGAGYSVSQPVQTTLLPGQQTTLTVTLSDGTAGIGLQGQLTIPSNDPAGPFQLTLRGTVDARPRVLSITRVDDGTGPVKVQIDFSGLLQSTPAANADFYTISGVNGQILPVVSAVYTQTGATSRVVLTTSTNSNNLPSGTYDVRIDGTQVRAANGAPLTAGTNNLISVQAWTDPTVVLIGANGNGEAGVLDGPDRTGVAPPEIIDLQDLNGDGILDYVATSRFTGELVFHWGQADGGYQTEILALPRADAQVIPEPTSLLTGDWNSDGMTDVIVYDNASDYFLGSFHRILVYVNDGHGHFTMAADTPIPVAEDVIGPLLAVRDFTGDGLADVAIAGPTVDGGGSVAIYGKDQFVGYSQVAVYPTEHTEWFPTSAVSADLNGDGRLDLIVPTTGYYVFEPRPVVYLATANGLILAPDLEYDGEAGDVGSGDFNSDGKQDIVIVNDNYSNSAGVHDGVVVSLLLGNGAGQFTAAANLNLVRRGVSLVATGDLNQDGKLDLILRADPFEQGGFDTTSELSLWTLLGDGTGGFDLTAPLVPLAPTGNVSPGNFVLHDLTGDGFPELSFGNLATGRIGLFVNDGAGHLTASTAAPLTSTVTAFNTQFYGEQGVFIADLNRDGFPDQLRVVSGAGIFQQQAIDVFWGNADGAFDLVSSLTVDSYSRTAENHSLGDIGFMRIGDLNNDGWIDILLGADNGTGSPLAVYLGVDGKNFVPANPYVVDGGPGVTTYMGQLADVNGDGNLDYVGLIAASPSYGIAVYFGDGTGKLTYNANTKLTINGTMDLVAPVVADFNGDGKLDLAVGTNYYDGSNFHNQVLVYNGQGNGKFTLGQTIERGEQDSGSELFTADINGDGELDLFTSSETDGSLNFYFNAGNGQFTEQPGLKVTLGYFVSRLLVSDFTGDGLDDLAVIKGTHQIGGFVTTVAILPGDGHGVFGEPQLVETGALRPQSIALVPSAGTINAGKFDISHPVLSVPAGVGNLSTTTPFETAVAVNPRLLIDPYTSDPYVISVATEPAHGTVVVQTQGTPENLADDTFSYLPADGYAGTDAFTYLVIDGRGGSFTRTVTVSVTPKNQNPVIIMASGAALMSGLIQYQAIDPNATVSDNDSPNFNGGRLTIDITSGYAEFDSLLLAGPSPGPDKIVEEFGNTVYYNDVLIGTVSGGYQGKPLTLLLTTDAATPAALTAILSRIAFSSDTITAPQQRTLTITLTDGDGGATTVTKSLNLPVQGNDDAPTLTLSQSETAYSAGGPPVKIDSSAAVTDSDSTHFAGGYLIVDYRFLFVTGDILGIQSAGSGAGQINVQGNKVRYGSQIFGEFDPSITSQVAVEFNSNATPAVVQALIRQITFSNSETNPDTRDRTIQFTLSDGAGFDEVVAYKLIVFGTQTQNQAPEIDLSSGSTTYSAGQSAVVIDAGATVSDSDSADFSGGQLTVSLQSGSSTSDRLGIGNQGTGAGQINLSGASVKYGSTVIGTYSGGFSDDSDLVISLNSSATSTTVQALIRNITFANSDASPSTTNRTIRFVLEDGDGGTSDAADKAVTVSVSPGNPAPTLQLPSGNSTYSKAAQAVAIDAGAIVANPTLGSGTLAAGVLTVSINDVNTGKKKLDIFSLSSLNGIGVSRGTQLVGGRLVTIYDLNSNVTAQTVQNAIRGINFMTSGKGLKTTTRSVKIQLEDSDGDKSAEVTKTINVSKKKVKVPRTRARNLFDQTD